MLSKTDLMRWAKSRDVQAAFAYLAIATGLAAPGLASHVFWSDEAMTAQHAHNFLIFGRFPGFDGTNVFAYHGGIDLTEKLEQFVGPYLQFYVTAASFALFGESTLTGRLPFLVIGLLSLVALHRWMKVQMGPGFPAWLPSLLLSCNVSFLLFTRNCRYYALVFLFFPLVFWAWAALRDSRRPWLTVALGAAAAAGLFAAHSMAGLASAVLLAMLLVLRRHRTRVHLTFVVVVACIVGIGAVSVLLAGDPTQLGGPSRGGIPLWENAITLMRWQIEALGSFEFVPLAVMPILALPFLLAKLKDQRPLALEGALAVAAVIVVLAVVAVVSPQPTRGPNTQPIPIMRYGLQVLTVGAIAAACVIVIVQRWLGQIAAVALAAVVMLTNVTYLGATAWRSTVWELVYEYMHWNPSGSDALVAYAQTLPDGTLIKIQPHNMTPQVQYYVPNLRYVAMLDRFKTIDPAVRATLPEYVFAGSVAPEIVMVGLDSTRLPNRLDIEGRLYTLKDVIKTYNADLTRPELITHEFRRNPANDERHVIAVFQLAGGNP